MLATRSFRLAATRFHSPAVYAWSVQTKTPLKLQQTTTWYTTPIAAAYSKDAKSGGPLNNTDVKLPSREQMEGFLFKSLVYIWDFAFYVFALSRKLFETYIWNNPTVQYYWKALLKRMEDARKEIKSK